MRFYSSEQTSPAPKKTLEWENYNDTAERRSVPSMINDADFRKLLDKTDEEPRRKPGALPPPRSHLGRPVQKKALEWDDYDDIPDRGSFPPPIKEADFRKLLEKIDEEPKRKPGVPPPRLPLGRLTPRAVHEEKQNDECKQVYVLGFDPRAYFLAFELAGCQFLDPVKLLIHKRILMNNWEHEGRRLMMCMGPKASYRMRAQAEWIGKGRQAASSEHIQQLIVTIPCSSTKVAIENIAHRIDNRTTICLIQDGLGVVEELNATLFQDPRKRPTFVLGHMTASVGYQKPVFFSTVLKKPGKLFLTALERGIGSLSLIKFHPPVERRDDATRFLHMLTTVPNLGAGAYGLESFLVQKLPAMVFHCVVEPLVIALDGAYSEVLRNERAMELADALLEEIFSVIWAMPEMIDADRVIEHCGKDALRKYTVKRLMEKGTSQSQLLSRVRTGRAVDIDYLNGYFVKRGEELGIKMPNNKMMIDVVKARVEGRMMEIDGLIPMETLDSTIPELN